MLNPNNELCPVAASIWYADVNYRGVQRLIACAVLDTSDGLFLVDPGPTVSLNTLVAALAASGTGFDAVRGILLTHIHLDHAGATGSIVQAHPHIKVFVHARGARHMVDPDRLLRSARRIYGARMDALWGAFMPVPAASVQVLHGGERLHLGERCLRVIYTPGHASHHVCFLDEQTGTAFAGDTAGMRVTGARYLVPVAPPPDIDVQAWHASIGRLRSWKAARLFLTHFGASSDVSWHLDQAASRLDDWARAVQVSLHTTAQDEVRAEEFHRQQMQHAQAKLNAQDRTPYQYMGQPRESWYGLARYWRKRNNSTQQ